MKFLRLILVSLLFVFGCDKGTEKDASNTKSDSSSEPKIAIVIHGGAGTILKKNMTAEKEAAYKATLEESIKAGYAILESGGSSLDAVQAAINIMEDSPLFNAGKGSVFTNAETNELDASIMDGKTLNAGASAGTKTVKNPINLARLIMEESPHVMMAGSGADIYAREQGLELVDSTYFFTEFRFNALQELKGTEKIELDHSDKQAFYDAEINDYKFGTVGCAALDKNGNLAAGTSTGGMTNKRWGRVGDAPIIGAGTYANNNTCAVSSTGWGEYFIRAMVAHDISALMDYKGLSLKEAAREVIHDKVGGLGGDGGIVAVDKDGNICMEFNTEGMYRASIDVDGNMEVKIYKE